jgi:hypothetical protein
LVSQDVLAQVLARADQIADRLFLRRRDPDGGEQAGPEQPGQLVGVAAVGLDLKLPRFRGDPET